MRYCGGISISHQLSVLICATAVLIALAWPRVAVCQSPPDGERIEADAPEKIEAKIEAKTDAGSATPSVPSPVEVHDPVPPPAVVVEAAPPGTEKAPIATALPEDSSQPQFEKQDAKQLTVEPPQNAPLPSPAVEIQEALPEFENGGSLVDDLLPEPAPSGEVYETAPGAHSSRGVMQWPGRNIRIGRSPLAHMNMLSNKLYNSIELPRFSHRDPDDPNRFTGAGEPLHGTSWRNRPLHVDLFFGGMFADDLVAGEISQSAGEFAGIRVGADFDHYWGVDFRYGAADLALNSHRNGSSLGSSHNQFFDLQLVHYWWGDSRWRPFAAVGLGLTKIDGGSRSDSLVQIPIGVGIKYFWYPWMALRFDAYNNLTIPGHSVDTVNHGSFTIGVEWRFGGRRKSYFPHHPGKYIW